MTDRCYLTMTQALEARLAKNTKTSLTVEPVGKQVRVMPDMAI